MYRIIITLVILAGWFVGFTFDAQAQIDDFCGGPFVCGTGLYCCNRNGGSCCQIGDVGDGDDCDWNSITQSCRTCFPAGTKITMWDGTKNNIEDVEVGDKVLSQTESGIKLSSTVTALDRPMRKHMCQISFTNGNTLRLTDEHPLFSINGWKAINPENTAKENATLPVYQLKKGDRMIKEDGSYDEVLYFGCWSQRIQTYNLIL